jgi:hypothetical protein
MSTIIKAIETRYKNYRFRSRLEARWAVFFDTLGIAWEYEKEGYDLGDAGWYLPDFWLPEMKIWAEVKPTQEDAALQKPRALARHMPGLIFFPMTAFLLPGESLLLYPYEENEGVITVCEELGFLRQSTRHKKLLFVAYHPYPPLDHHLGWEWLWGSEGYRDDWDLSQNADYDKAKKAIAAARSARFEHGESGVNQ